MPLSEVMLIEKEDRLKIHIVGSYNYKCLLRVWDWYRKQLAPFKSPLMSFLHHPMFWVAAHCSDFSHWKRRDMDRFYQLGRGMRRLTKQEIAQKVGIFSRLDYQYK